MAVPIETSKIGFVITNTMVGTPRDQLTQHLESDHEEVTHTYVQLLTNMPTIPLVLALCFKLRVRALTYICCSRHTYTTLGGSPIHIWTNTMYIPNTTGGTPTCGGQLPTAPIINFPPEITNLHALYVLDPGRQTSGDEKSNNYL